MVRSWPIIWPCAGQGAGREYRTAKSIAASAIIACFVFTITVQSIDNLGASRVADIKIVDTKFRSAPVTPAEICSKESRVLRYGSAIPPMPIVLHRSFHTVDCGAEVCAVENIEPNADNRCFLPNASADAADNSISRRNVETAENVPSRTIAELSERELTFKYGYSWREAAREQVPSVDLTELASPQAAPINRPLPVQNLPTLENQELPRLYWLETRELVFSRGQSNDSTQVIAPTNRERSHATEIAPRKSGSRIDSLPNTTRNVFSLRNLSGLY